MGVCRVVASSFHSRGSEQTVCGGLVLQGPYFLAGEAVRGSLYEAEGPYPIHSHYTFRSCVTERTVDKQAGLPEDSAPTGHP